MAGGRSLGSLLSLAGTVFQLGVVLGMSPPDLFDDRSVHREQPWAGHGFGPMPLRVWAPHMENLGDGSPAFLGRRCPGRQQMGNPFRIDRSPLPEAYDPHAFPNSDVIACVRLDSAGFVLKAQLVGGTGSAALDRHLLRAVFRQWSFAPADGSEKVRGWQRIRLNSARRDSPLPEAGPGWVSM